MRPAWPIALCVALAACPGPGASDAGCDASACGPPPRPCSVQTSCLTEGYGRDNPLGECVAGGCAVPDAGIEVDFVVNTSPAYAGFGLPIYAMNTRFVALQAVDGSAVSCAILQALAGDAGAAPNALESSQRFNLIAWDVTPTVGAGGAAFQQPYLNTSTSDGFVVWTELWSGHRDATTGLPTGQRDGWGCFEGLAPLTPADDKRADGGPGRAIEVVMPAPQG